MAAGRGRDHVDNLLLLNTEDSASKALDPCLSDHRGLWTGGLLSVSGVSTVCASRRHYKEKMVELINRSGADPAVLFSPSEMVSELQRWQVPVPPRTCEEPELLYAHRLRLVSDIIHSTRQFHLKANVRCSSGKFKFDIVTKIPSHLQQSCFYL